MTGNTFVLCEECFSLNHQLVFSVDIVKNAPIGREDEKELLLEIWVEWFRELYEHVEHEAFDHHLNHVADCVNIHKKGILLVIFFVNFEL